MPCRAGRDSFYESSSGQGRAKKVPCDGLCLGLKEANEEMFIINRNIYTLKQFGICYYRKVFYGFRKLGKAQPR
jgi:hypothetical protein